MTTDPSFEIPARPQRRYPYDSGVEYEGETVFHLKPASERPDAELQTLVENVLADETYTYGDWLDLPLPLYLVHDERTRDVFRVVVRDQTVELHVLPATESEGLRSFYRALTDRSPGEWSVELTVDRAQ